MMLKAYKYRLYPTKTQEVLLAKHFGCARYIYNYGLERKIKSYAETKKSVSRFTISADLPKLKKAEATKWLSEVNSLSLQAALLNLDMAFNAYMDYKAEWYGKNIIRIGRFEPSSKMCACGHIYRGLKLSDRVWACPVCGSVNQRDLLAAQNIKKFAFRLNNTARTAGIYAEDSMNPVRGAASEILHVGVVETHTPLACG